jgi:hypothetical protein
MLRLADQSDFQNIYDLIKSKTKIFESPFIPDSFDTFFRRLQSGNTTRIFLSFNDTILQGILFTRLITNVIPAWYSHLIVVKNGLTLRTSHSVQASLYDSAIDYYEQENITMFFYVQPIRYEKLLNNPVRQLSSKLQGYSSVIVDSIPAGVSNDSILIKTLLQDRTPVVDVRVIMKVKTDQII